MKPLLLAAGLALGLPASSVAAQPCCAPDSVYRGAERELAVRLPRHEEADVALDGELSEALWESAAVLTDFTQFQPSEGAPASERTEVRLFYTPSALYVGIVARAADPARVRATLADRDDILRDDHVQILLDTFLDRRRAFAFYLNPLGIQQDGIRNEAGGQDPVDFNPDFLFQSRGRVTPEGYVVEARIPFQSLKFPAGDEQRWGIQVVRGIAATGATESWAPLSRSNPSWLAQSGTLVGLHDLRPGRLLEINPVATGKREGYSDGEGRFRRNDFEPDFGVNLKYGITSNLTLDATYNPDFSQVEADAGQITTNERFALFFPEKRPFFLEGAEIFATPGERLVYTRSIVSPIAGAKLTGKVGGTTLGYLGAVDESPLSNPGLAPEPGRALFNVARLQRDVGEGSLLGALLTDRQAAGAYNRVAAVDGQIRFRDVYAWEFQLAQSWTREWTAAAGAPAAAPAVELRDVAAHLFQTAIDRTGRNFGFRAQITDVPEDFRARSGFIERTGITDLFFYTRYAGYGAPGALLEGWRASLMYTPVYEGRDFWAGRGPLEGTARTGVDFNLRGNNRISLNYSNAFFTLDPTRYRVFTAVDATGRERNGAELVAPGAELSGLHGASLGFGSAYLKTVAWDGELAWRQTPIFAEGTPGWSWSARAEALLRPTEALRAQASLRYARLHRERDGSLYSEALLPRLKLEYQLSRSIFVRAVGQYSIEEVDLLRAPDGVPYRFRGEPVRVRQGERRPWDRLQTNPLRYDLLFSYQPSPGTVVFAGYGREMMDREAYRFSPLEPTADGLFLKISYLFRR